MGESASKITLADTLRVFETAAEPRLTAALPSVLRTCESPWKNIRAKEANIDNGEIGGILSN